MTANHFEAMSRKWNELTGINFYDSLLDQLDFSKTHDINYLKEIIINIVGKENNDKVVDTVLPGVLITAIFYSKGKDTVTFSKEETKDILVMQNNYVAVENLSLNNRCLYVKIADGLLTATDETGKILEVDGFYLLNKKTNKSIDGLNNALLVYAVVSAEKNYGMYYLSFPYGNKGNLFDYYRNFAKKIGLDENAYQSKEILEFALNSIDYMQAKKIL
ncbi:hypothetical protein [Priestia megaterium]|uniref:hypothetical protein n=1 Tax=Priestia megaterium TaxID=1404 RepID=UPI00300B99D1